MQVAASERTSTWAPGTPPADPHFFGIEWNAENQLKRVLQNAAEVARYKYDPLGRRVERVAGGTTTLWAYDSEDILRETVGGTATKYVHGPGIDEPLAAEDAAGVLNHVHADGLGSVVRSSNAAGAVISSRQYDAFGNLEVGATSGYAFTGREWDAAAGLTYYRARYYQAALGRFISADQIGFLGGINFYAYALNDPVIVIDPSGHGGTKKVGPVRKVASGLTAIITGKLAYDCYQRMKACDTKVTTFCDTEYDPNVLATSPTTGYPYPVNEIKHAQCITVNSACCLPEALRSLPEIFWNEITPPLITPTPNAVKTPPESTCVPQRID